MTELERENAALRAANERLRENAALRAANERLEREIRMLKPEKAALEADLAALEADLKQAIELLAKYDVRGKMNGAKP